MTSSLLLCLVFGCQAELPGPGIPVTAREWVAASARRHDPAARWPAFRSEVSVVTTLPGGSSYTNEILLDRARDTFRRRAVDGEAVLTQSIGPTGVCTATYTAPDASARDSALAGVGVADPCAVFGWRRGYYDFLLGLPMSALADGAELDFGMDPNAARVDTTVFGAAAVEIRLTYPARPGEPTWWLYVSRDDYRLVATRFVLPGGGGEWLHYPREVGFDGFLLKAQQNWYRLDGMPVSSDSIDYAPPAEG